MLPNRPSRERRALPPLDPAALDRLALRYVERFQTTRGRMIEYLKRKIRERGWEGAGEGDAADPAGVAERMAELGYIDDRSFGDAKASAMARRGLGRRRVVGALRQAGIDEQDATALAPAIAARTLDTALAFARRKRIGPFADSLADRPTREKQIAAMIRGGHEFTLSRRIVAMEPGADLDSLAELFDG